eukprot:641153-Pyramimonas_sp.AAC.1
METSQNMHILFVAHPTQPDVGDVWDESQEVMSGFSTQMRDLSWTVAELHSGQTDLRALIQHNQKVLESDRMQVSLATTMQQNTP